MPNKGDIIKNYKVIRKIGRGGSGDVYLVETVSSPHEQYALKIMENVSINEELKIGLTLSKKCGFLVRFMEVFQKDEDLYVVMEYCSGGDLSKRLEQKKPLSDVEIYQFMHNSSVAIKTLHDAGIIHRDIKPSNFFHTPDGYKLGDYGTARPLTQITMTRAGTEGFISPEIMNGSGQYTVKADVFSFGITIMHIVVGHSPFAASSAVMVNLQLAALGTPVESVLRHPHPAMALARRMISQNPTERPTIDEVLHTPFLSLTHVVPVLGLVPMVAASSAQNEDAEAKFQLEAMQKTIEDQKKELENQRKEIENLRKVVSLDATSSKKAAASTSVRNSAVARVAAAAQDIPASFRPYPKDGCAVSGSVCTFISAFTRTIFLDTPITEGVYQWVVRIRYGPSFSQFCLGAAPAALLSACDSSYLGVLSGTVSLYGSKSSEGKLSSFVIGINKNEEAEGKGVPDNSLVAIEADAHANTRMLCFFVNEQKIPHAASGMCFPAHFGMTGHGMSQSFTSVSFRRLPSATPSAITPLIYPVKK